MLKIKNETETSAEIYISGTIIDDEDSLALKFFGDGDLDGYQFPAELKRQLDDLKDKDLNIYINSYGGSIPAGVAMANMIKRHKGRTTAIVEGYCCSIATQIFFSSDECKMYSNAYLMIHKPWTQLSGNAEELRKAAEILDTIQEGLENTYLSKIQPPMSSADIHEMTEKETWLTGSEAAEKFKIEVLTGTKLQNCMGSKEKLKAQGARKIPSTLKFSRVEDEASEQEVSNIISRLKGLI